MYNLATDRFEIVKTKGPSPAGQCSASIFTYVPSIKKAVFIHTGNRCVAEFDPQTNTWTRPALKGPQPPFEIDAGACLDLKRDRIYFGGGYYNVAPLGTNAFWCYDLKTNAFVDLQPKGKPCGTSALRW